MPSQVVESRGRLFTLPVRPNVKGPRGLYPLGDPEEQAIEEKYNRDFVLFHLIGLLTLFGKKLINFFCGDLNVNDITEIDCLISGPQYNLKT